MVMMVNLFLWLECYSKYFFFCGHPPSLAIKFFFFDVHIDFFLLRSIHNTHIEYFFFFMDVYFICCVFWSWVCYYFFLYVYVIRAWAMRVCVHVLRHTMCVYVCVCAWCYARCVCGCYVWCVRVYVYIYIQVSLRARSFLIF
jgi:hypothetical protein